MSLWRRICTVNFHRNFLYAAPLFTICNPTFRHFSIYITLFVAAPLIYVVLAALDECHSEWELFISYIKLQCCKFCEPHASRASTHASISTSCFLPVRCHHSSMRIAFLFNCAAIVYCWPSLLKIHINIFLSLSKAFCNEKNVRPMNAMSLLARLFQLNHPGFTDFRIGFQL